MILRILLSTKTSPVSREELIRALWNDESFIDDNTLTVNIAVSAKARGSGAAELYPDPEGPGVSD